MKRLLCWILGHNFNVIYRLAPTGRASRVICSHCNRQFARMDDTSEWTCGVCIPWEQAKPFYDRMNQIHNNGSDRMPGE